VPLIVPTCQSVISRIAYSLFLCSFLLLFEEFYGACKASLNICIAKLRANLEASRSYRVEGTLILKFPSTFSSSAP